MLTEKWSRWESQHKLATRYTLENFVNGLDKKFEILLAEKQNPHLKLRVKFVHSASIFRISKIKFRQKTLGTLHSQYGVNYTEWPFFIVTNSPYADWAERQSCNVYKANTFVVFVIITQDTILEIMDSADSTGPILIDE